MSKEAYWFRHDSNARNDLRMVRLSRLCGMEGVGVFWCIIEMLREATDYQLPMSEVEDIVYTLRVDAKIVQSIFDCKLLTKDGDNFYSKSLKKRLSKFEELREKRVEAGRKGGKAKASAKQKPSNAKAKPSEKSRVEKSRVEENRKEDTIDTVLVFDFENLWSLYGKIGNKKTAFSNYSNLSKAQVLEMNSKVRLYVASTKTNGDYPSRMHLSTYLNKDKEQWNNSVLVKESTRGRNESDTQYTISDKQTEEVLDQLFK